MTKVLFNIEKNLEFILRVGDGVSLKGSDNFYMRYAGMLTKEVFSMIYEERAERGKDSYNLFFNLASQKQISVEENNYFEVLDVNPEKIKLKYLGEK